jgi:hypothetical protein
MKQIMVTIAANKTENDIVESIFKKFVPKKKGNLLVVHARESNGHLYVGGHANIAIIPHQNENRETDAETAKALNALKVTGWDYLPENLIMDPLLCISVWFSTAHQYPDQVIAELKRLKFKVKEITCDLADVELLQTKREDLNKPLSLLERWGNLFRLHSAKFTDWEKGFVESIGKQLKSGKALSAKQLEYAEKVLSKYKVGDKR